MMKKQAPSEFVLPKRQFVLTNREKDVLRLYAAGHSHEQTAEELGISPKTIGSYLQRVREKIRAKNRADVIAYAIGQGMLKSD